MEDREVGEEVAEEGFGPVEAVGLGPVPVVDVGAVGAVLHDPPLVALAVTSHLQCQCPLFSEFKGSDDYYMCGMV